MVDSKSLLDVKFKLLFSFLVGVIAEVLTT